uniref:Uncharacterized protein n=1 Tax=Amphimedon queenslandica TaxID=400682 RepID=A0A1X7U5M8_AMPQE
MILSTEYKEKMIALVVGKAHCVKSWGDSFRKAYAHLGDIRNLLPTSVNIMAFTTTTDTYKTVCQRLSLKDPVVIGCPPN